MKNNKFPTSGMKPDRNDPMFDDFGIWMFENDPKAKAHIDRLMANRGKNTAEKTTQKKVVKKNTKKK